jgi:hypothetical protein
LVLFIDFIRTADCILAKRSFHYEKYLLLSFNSRMNSLYYHRFLSAAELELWFYAVGKESSVMMRLDEMQSDQNFDERKTRRHFCVADKRILVGVDLVSVILFSIQLYSLNSTYFLVDFSKGYCPAARAMIEGDTYFLARLMESAGFVNIPIFAYLFVPLAWFGIKSSKIIFLLLGLSSIALSFFWMWRRLDAQLRLFLIPLFLGNGPLWNSIIIGNITHFVLLLILLSISLLESRQNFLAGFLLGVAVIMKPMIFLFGVYFLMRRNFWAVAGGVACLVFAMVCSLVFLGLDLNLLWFNKVLIGYADKAMGVFNMESINAFVLRLWVGPELLGEWKSLPLSSEQTLVKYFFVSFFFLPVFFCFLALAAFGFTFFAQWSRSN